MTTKHKVSDLSINTSFILHGYKRQEDNRQQLKAHNRIYRGRKLIERFEIFLQIRDEPIYLLASEITKGMVKLDVANSIVYNFFIKSVKNEIDRIAEKQLKEQGFIDKDDFRKDIKAFGKRFAPTLTIERPKAIRADTDNIFSNINPRDIDQAVIDDINSEAQIDADTGQPIMFEELENVIIHKQADYNKQLAEQAIKNLSTEERYKRGYFNRNNIFELFASTYYLDITNKFYSKIVIRLFEYRERMKPKEDIRYLNSDWAINFFQFLNTNGYYSINTKNFDPFNYDTVIFHYNKERKEYEDQTFQKMIHIFKQIVKQLKKQKLLDRVIDLDDLTFNALRKGTVKKGTRIEHHLTKDEFDELFKYKFQKSKLEQYQKTFDDLLSSGIAKRVGNDSLIVTIEKLNKYRDIFCFMTMAGGQRGIEEYNSTELRVYSKTEKVISFYQNKGKNVVVNPLNVYTAELLKRCKNNIEKVTDYEEYRAYLKLIAYIVDFKRGVQEKIDKNEWVLIKNILNPYMCRKTFGTIMYDQLRLSDEDIALFTGHKNRNQSELSSSYINKKNIENKKVLIKDLILRN